MVPLVMMMLITTIIIIMTMPTITTLITPMGAVVQVFVPVIVVDVIAI